MNKYSSFDSTTSSSDQSNSNNDCNNECHCSEQRSYQKSPTNHKHKSSTRTRSMNGNATCTAPQGGEHEMTDLGRTSEAAAAAAATVPHHHHHHHHHHGHQYETLEIDDAIEKLGMGAFQRRILWAAGLCFMSDSMEVLLLSFLSIVLQAEWGLSDEQAATVTSVVFLGAMAGTLTLGPLGDRMGRKPVFTLTAAIIAISGFATAAARTYAALLLLRFTVGFGVGGLTVPFDVLAEFVTNEHRGRDLLVIEFFWTAGTLLVPVLAFISLKEEDGDNESNNIGEGWRIFVILCSIPCFLSTILGMFFVPESPRWLLTQGRHDEALLVLRRAAKRNKKDPDELFPLNTRLVDSAHQVKSSLRDLFAPKWRRITVLLWVSWIGLAFVYYGTIMAVTLVFAEIDASQQDNDDNTYSFDYGAIFTSASSEIAGTTFVILLVDRVGRIKTQTISYFCGGVCILTLGWLAAPNNPTRSHLIVTAFLARLFFMGATCTTWVSTAEILTTEVRSTGHSFANAVGRLGGSLSPYLVSTGVPKPVIGTTLCLIAFITTFSTSKLPETRGRCMGIESSSPTEPQHTVKLKTRSNGERGDYDII